MSTRAAERSARIRGRAPARRDRGKGSAAARVLLLPGLGGSGPGHWQALWAAADPSIRLVEQRDWSRAERRVWVRRLREEISSLDGPYVLAAHSIGCALAAHALAELDAAPPCGLLLVAPADVDARERTPDAVRSLAPMPLERLPGRVVVAASASDPYVSLRRARRFARAWGAEFVDLGEAGHVNDASGHGPWPEGRRLLESIRRDAATSSGGASG